MPVTQDDNSSNPFICNVCKKTYGRVDHLARHFRTHTNEKPFKCRDCGKGFARVDLLRRHANLHSGDERTGRKRRVRASQACTACATIKVKCDQEKPCKRCLASGLECQVDSSGEWKSESANDTMDVTESIAEPTQDPDHSQPIPTNDHVVIQAPLPTPPTIVDQANVPGAATLTDELSLTEFLREIFQPIPGDSTAQQRLGAAWNANGTFTPRNLMDVSQDLSADFHDFNSALTDGWDAWLNPSFPTDAPEQLTTDLLSDVTTPSIDESIGMSSAAFRRSAWQWIPTNERGNKGQVDLDAIPEDTTHKDQAYRTVHRCLSQPLDSRCRDRIVAMLLSMCDKPHYQRIVTFFPPPAVLDTFINSFLFAMDHKLDSWLHVPSFKPGECMPELLTIMVSAGAVQSSTAQSQKLGYALQETVRMAIPEVFEADNTNTRRLPALQMYAIMLDVGIWSGNKRTMEIAESQALPLITMLRRAGHFRRRLAPTAAPAVTDDSAELERKWHDWIEAESWKRLAYHVFLYTAQVSITFRTPPAISYAEVSLDLPAPRRLWQARTATEWRDLYLSIPETGSQAPTFIQTMYDAHRMGLVRKKIDLDLTLYLVLLSHWCLTWEYIQLDQADKAQTSLDMRWTGSLLASSQRQELRRLMDNFEVEIDSWGSPVPKEVVIVSVLLRMNLYVSFEDLQLLAGKEGDEEARRAVPALKQWAKRPESREAVWHAGQIVRFARLSNPSKRQPRIEDSWMREFNAITLYHAGLTLWVYGLLSRAIASEQPCEALPPNVWSPAFPGEEFSSSDAFDKGELFHVDGDSHCPASERHRFISLGKSKPVLSASLTHRSVVTLDSPKLVMDVIIQIMNSYYASSAASHINNSVQARPPAIVENLTQLLRDLGDAASAAA